MTSAHVETKANASRGVNARALPLSRPLLSSWLTVSSLTWWQRKQPCVRVYLPVLEDRNISAASIWAIECGNIASAHERNVGDERPTAATVWKGHASRVDALHCHVLSPAGGCVCLCMCLCVFLYFLHTEDQNPDSTSKVRTFGGNENRLMDMVLRFGLGCVFVCSLHM